jgi:hypothetical protein
MCMNKKNIKAEIKTFDELMTACGGRAQVLEDLCMLPQTLQHYKLRGIARKHWGYFEKKAGATVELLHRLRG